MNVTGFAKDSQLKVILGKTLLALFMFFLYRMKSSDLRFSLELSPRLII
jgi:hypothetical protein